MWYRAKVGHEMKWFEIRHTLLRPFLGALHNQVHKELTVIVKTIPGQRPKLLDVGGRKSHYTIGISADVTITELPRETDLQRRLNLGIDDKILQQTLQRRSNIEQIIFDDMENSSLPDGAYDIAVAIEVLEHVENDEEFIKNVYRALKPGGVFLMSTPNGDYLTIVNNPDHKRHYRRQELISKLARSFEIVDACYAVVGGHYHTWGLKSWSMRRPVSTVASAFGNFINRWQSSRPPVREQAHGTHHLLAVAKKAK